jgi:hypothetical protein
MFHSHANDCDLEAAVISGGIQYNTIQYNFAVFILCFVFIIYIRNSMNFETTCNKNFYFRLTVVS